MEPSVYITEELIRRQGPQRSWQDRIPDTHLDNGSNEERETIREHEGFNRRPQRSRIPDAHLRKTIREHESHAPSPSANPKERIKAGESGFSNFIEDKECFDLHMHFL